MWCVQPKQKKIEVEMDERESIEFNLLALQNDRLRRRIRYLVLNTPDAILRERVEAVLDKENEDIRKEIERRERY